MVTHEAHIFASSVDLIYHAAMSGRDIWDGTCSSALTDERVEDTLFREDNVIDIPVGFISATPKVAQNTINTAIKPPSLKLYLEHAPAVRNKYRMAHDTNFFHPNVDQFLPASK